MKEWPNTHTHTRQDEMMGVTDERPCCWKSLRPVLVEEGAESQAAAAGHVCSKRSVFIMKHIQELPKKKREREKQCMFLIILWLDKEVVKDEGRATSSLAVEEKSRK